MNGNNNGVNAIQNFLNEFTSELMQEEQMKETTILRDSGQSQVQVQVPVPVTGNSLTESCSSVRDSETESDSDSATNIRTDAEDTEDPSDRETTVETDTDVIQESALAVLQATAERLLYESNGTSNGAANGANSTTDQESVVQHTGTDTGAANEGTFSASESEKTVTRVAAQLEQEGTNQRLTCDHLSNHLQNQGENNVDDGDDDTRVSDDDFTDMRSFVSF